MNMDKFIDMLAAATIDGCGNDNDITVVEVPLQERVDHAELLWKRYFLKARMNDRVIVQLKMALDLAIQNIHSSIVSDVVNNINEHLAQADELNAEDLTKLKKIIIDYKG